jgi:gliding motility-associated-like protein
VFTALAAGTYHVFAKDQAMRYFRDTLILTEPPAMNIISSVTPATCSSLSGDGSIDITVIGGTGIKTYNWSTGSASQDITGLDMGDYIITVTDQNNCINSDTISVPALTTVEASAGSDTALCPGKGLVLNGKGGTTYSWTPVTGLSNPNVPNPVASVTGNISYVVTVVGLNNSIDTDTINITVRPAMHLEAGKDTYILKYQVILLDAKGDSFINYSWYPVSGLEHPDKAQTNASPDKTTKYVLSATDSFGCITSDTLNVRLIEKVTIYNVFSPNDDGQNDFWDIDNAEAFPDILVEVYARWGQKMFSSKGYSNDKRWDGTFKGKQVPIGTYYYIVIPYPGATPITGPLTIVR